jgi:hypothetical protein
MIKRLLIIAFSIILTVGIIYLVLFIKDIWKFSKAEADPQKAEILRLEIKVKDGDIIFQTSKSNQSKAIQLATNSKYSHMGVIYWQGVNPYVYEATQPVKLTSLSNWINRGVNHKYVVKRLINAENILTPDKLLKMRKAGERFKNKDYDIYFGWSDEKIYCSELVWKIYKEAVNIEIGKLQKLKEFNLNDPIVKKIMKDRYGSKIPMEETVISPESIFESDMLFTVLKN